MKQCPFCNNEMDYQYSHYGTCNFAVHNVYKCNTCNYTLDTVEDINTIVYPQKIKYHQTK